MPELRLDLLGRPELRRGGDAVRFPTKKTLALLAYLAVERTLHTREKLAGMFWPDSDDTRARGALRYTLTQLRTGLGEASGLVAQREAVGFDGKPSAIALDVHALERIHDLVRPSPPPPVPATDALAVSGGEFMEGFSLSDSASFEDWASRQRTYWAQRVEVVLRRLAEAHEDRGDLDGALALAERWCARSPLDEPAHVRLIRVQLARGDRSAALRVYDAYRARLASELESEPSAEVERIASRLRDATPAVPKRASPASPAPAPLVEVPLVGRGAAFTSLAERYRAVSNGRPAIVLLAGEAGIGKTRLGSEFLAWATAEGADTLYGRAFETGGRLPYQPLVDALRPRVERENAPDDVLEDVWLTEIARLLVELRERYPDLPAPGPEDGASRTRLFEALTRLVAALAERAPVVLLVDDVQWADVASLDVLLYAAKRWADSGARVLLLLAVRTEALASPSTLPAWLLGHDRNVAVARVDLEPLSAADTHKLVEMLRAGPDFADWLYAETGGQPFFITETLRALIEAGRGFEKGSAASGGVLPGIKQVVRARVERLDAATRTILLAASVLGQSFTLEDVRAVADVSENEALGAMEELVRAQLLREDEAHGKRGAPAYLFSHDKIRDVVYAEASDGRRRVFHRRCVDALERSGAAAAEIARHAVAAGLDEAALAASMQAGADAMRLLAASDAILHFARAIDLATGLGKQDVALEALILRARARSSIAQWVPAIRDFESALAQIDPAERERRAELLVCVSEAQYWSLDVPGVQASGKAAATLAHEAGREDLEMAALGWVAGGVGADGDLPRAIEVYERAVAIAKRLAVPPPAHVLTLHSLTLYWQGRVEEAFTHSRAAVEVARTTKDVSLLMYSLSQLGLALGASGRYPEAWAVFDEARRFGRDYGIDSLLARSIAMAAGTRLETFDFARAEELSREATELSRSAAWPPAAASASIDLLFNFVRRGEVGRAEDLVGPIAETVERAAGFHGWLWRLRLKQARAEIAFAREAYSEVVDHATDVIEQSLATTRQKYRVLGLATRGRARAELGKRDEALGDLNEALVLARRTADPNLFVRVAAALLPLAGDDALHAETEAALGRLSSALPEGRSRDAFDEGARDVLGLRRSGSSR